MKDITGRTEYIWMPWKDRAAMSASMVASRCGTAVESAVERAMSWRPTTEQAQIVTVGIICLVALRAIEKGCRLEWSSPFGSVSVDGRGTADPASD